MKASLAFAAATLLALSGVSGAQPPAGITPEMIATVLPEQGAPKAEPGAYKVASEPVFGSPGLMTFSSGVQSTSDALKNLHGPVLLINGHERDFAMARSKETYDAIESLPAFYGARHGAGHTATAYHSGGGEFANVATNWVLWQFKENKKASAMFVGAKCTLCTNPNWDVESKRLAK